ncbi:hypothetical protein [Hymenobacter crusticola]|uniref:Photosynthesis system II assembly factor Ycf48/Hcf136-like domain-containing protein n=1 Tax=Hymenobacter crusticola TaxID=1770526 RepID=A0A243W8N6_9BACT|nr:hypothetical protein [Hymenobacter crusticola]OUJ71378.1 hypothetical protein BXP70_21715 [Hymenobacter crusticola]
MKIKSLLVTTTLLLTLGACQKDTKEDAQPEYADWYALRAPNARAIEAVTGDIDRALAITTGYQIYRTTDRGRTWRTSDYKVGNGILGFLQQQDTLLALTSRLGSVVSNSSTAYAASPSHYSLDQGLTWKPYRNWRRGADFEPRTALNRVSAASGTEYSIDVEQVPASSTSSGSYLETVGINSSTGQKLALPNEHQINSLYVDAKSRLYVAASAPLCGQGQAFAFCGEQNGVLYVSKKPQP